MFRPLFHACSKMCLRNRHGEDCTKAAASGQWVCPGCRGSCGVGCLACCNCGPCRKKVGTSTGNVVFGVRLLTACGPLPPCCADEAGAPPAHTHTHMRARTYHSTQYAPTHTHCPPAAQMGLEPTHQVARLAKEAGFTNVHDYLVCLVPGK